MSPELDRLVPTACLAQGRAQQVPTECVNEWVRAPAFITVCGTLCSSWLWDPHSCPLCLGGPLCKARSREGWLFPSVWSFQI